MTAIAILLVLFCVLGAFDGFYFHLYKYKLHQVPEAQREHFIHTLRAFVFVPLSMLLFVFNTAGWLLYLALVAVALDLILEVVDILEEREARKPLGGISSAESLVHVFGSSFKFGAIVLMLAAKAPSAYQISSPMLQSESLPMPLVIVGLGLAVGAAIGGIHSIGLVLCGRIEPCGNSRRRATL